MVASPVPEDFQSPIDLLEVEDEAVSKCRELRKGAADLIGSDATVEIQEGRLAVLAHAVDDLFQLESGMDGSSLSQGMEQITGQRLEVVGSIVVQHVESRAE
jgi:hypothetical protein